MHLAPCVLIAHESGARVSAEGRVKPCLIRLPGGDATLLHRLVPGPFFSLNRGGGQVSRISPRKTFSWIFLTIAALIAMRLFFVEELIAAFLIFSVQFAILVSVVLVLVLLDHVFQTALSWAEACWKSFGRAPAPKVGQIPQELAVGPSRFPANR
jgi:hypothetical protein